MRWIPWVIKPAKYARSIIARTSATKELFPEIIREKVGVQLEACVTEEKEFSYPDDTGDILDKGSGKNIIYTGRICDIKNLPVLIPVMAAVTKKFPDARLHIIGDGDMAPMLKRLTKENGLEKTVIFYGNVERAKLLKAVNQSDIFVFPSLREGASWSLLEAMHFELPIVAFDTNGMHDTLSDESAILVPLEGKNPKDATEAFVQCTMLLMNMSNDKIKSLGKHAHERLSNVHSAKGVASFIEKMCNDPE